MAIVDRSDMDHVSYILILFSIASLIFLYANILIGLWDRLAHPRQESKGFANGHALPNSHAMENGQVRIRDAEEFELDGLTSDDEDDPRQGMLRSSHDGGSRGHAKYQAQEQ